MLITSSIVPFYKFKDLVNLIYYYRNSFGASRSSRCFRFPSVLPVSFGASGSSRCFRSFASYCHFLALWLCILVYSPPSARCVLFSGSFWSSFFDGLLLRSLLSFSSYFCIGQFESGGRFPLFDSCFHCLSYSFFCRVLSGFLTLFSIER